MNIIELTHTFLPNLVKEYTAGHLDLHALVDFDLWRTIFPESANAPEEGRFLWYQIRLNAFVLKDDTLLLVYTLPVPLQKGHPKFVAIRLDRDTRQAHYYLLQKPQSIEDQWDILWLPFPKAADRMKLEFKCKIDGTDSLRNMVLTVQQQPFTDDDYNDSFLSSLLRNIKNTVKPIDG